MNLTFGSPKLPIHLVVLSPENKEASHQNYSFSVLRSISTFSGRDSGDCHLASGISWPLGLFTPIPVPGHVLTMTQVLFSDPWPCPFCTFLGSLATNNLKQWFHSPLESNCGCWYLVFFTGGAGQSLELSQTSCPFPAEGRSKTSIWFTATHGHFLSSSS